MERRRNRGYKEEGGELASAYEYASYPFLSSSLYMKNNGNALLSLISLYSRVFIIFRNFTKILRWFFDGLATVYPK